MVIPVGERYQQTLYLLKKIEGKLETEALLPDAVRAHDRRGREQRKIQPDPTRPTFDNGDFEE